MPELECKPEHGGCGLFFTTDQGAFHQHIMVHHKDHDKRKGSTCFCGGTIRQFTFRRAQEDYGWETYCERCGYVYDED